MYAPELYAISQGSNCNGPNECHWCQAPCGRNLTHDEGPTVTGVRTTSTAKRYGNPYICLGCWLFRRKKLTIQFSDGSFRDGKCPMDFSWFICPEVAWAVRPAGLVGVIERLKEKEPGKSPYEWLLKPPAQFVLSLVEPGIPNQLHLAIVNDHTEILADTPLHFTSNNKPLKYSVYELEHALRKGPNGTEPGTQELIRTFGPYALPEETREPGRPKERDEDGRSLKKPVSRK